MSLTVESLLKTYREVMDSLPPAPPEVRVSVHAVKMVESRIYPKRKAKNASHLRRMNNKWRRRYGRHAQPAAYLMDTSVLGRPGKILFVHPSLVPAGALVGGYSW